MARTQTLRVELVGDTRGFNRAMVRAQGRANTFGNAIRGLGLAVGGVTVAAGKLAIDFDKSMRNVNSIAQLPERRLQKLEKRVLGLAGKTAQAPKTLADGLYDLVSSGFDANQSMVILNKSAKAATAGLTDTATSTKAVAAVLNAYHLKAKDAGKVSDTLFETVNRGVITFEELASTVGDVLPFASSLGVNLDQVGASISTMTKAGISAPETMTRIKNVMVSLLKPGEGLKKALHDVGAESGEALVKQKGFQGALEDLIGTTDGSKKAVAKLFPNIRALGGALALTGDNAKGADTDLKAFGDTSGATDKALKQQAKSTAYQWNRLKAQVEALAISYGQKLLPRINDVIGLLSNPHITIDEKFRRLRGMLLKDFDRLAPKITAAIDRVTPAIIAAVASSAPKAAEHFAKAFVNAGVWSKLIIGGVLLRRLGGLRAFEMLGLQAGTAMGQGMAAGAAASGARGRGGGAAGAVGGGLVGGALARGKNLFKGAGKLAGKFAALDFAINLVDSKGNPIAAAINSAHDLTFGIVPKVHVKSGSEKQNEQLVQLSGSLDNLTKKRDTRGLADLIDKFRTMGDEARAFNADKVAAQYDKLTSRAQKALRGIVGSERDTAQAGDRFAAAIKGLRLKGSKDFDGLVQHVTFGSKQILKIGGGNSEKTQAEITRQFRLARQRVQEAMDGQVISVKEGTRLLHQLAVKELGIYGIKAGKVDVVLAKGANGELRPHQRGGHIAGGKPSGDSIPAMLERGEYVLNRKAVQKVGRGRLDRLNFGDAPRFQQGGTVGLQGGGSVTGDTDFLPALMRALRGLSAAAHTPIFVQSGRRTVAEQLAQGPSTPGHPVAGPNGPHVRGVAADITPGYSVFGRLAGRFGLGFTVMPQEPWHIQLLNAATAGGARAMDAFKGLARPVLKGPASAQLEASQGALDRVLSAANQSVAAAIGASFANGSESGAGFSGGSATGNGADLMRGIATQRGWNFPDWWALDASETSHGRNLTNPTSTARLRGQFLDFNWGKYGPGSDPRQNPTMAQQIEAMAAYIADRYGNPTAAWAFHRAHNYYQHGGLVGLQAGGAPWGWQTPRSGDFGRGGGLNAAHGFGINQTLKQLRGRKTPKLRRQAIRALTDKIKRVGLPGKLAHSLTGLATDSNTFGEFADRASAITDTDQIQTALENELARRQAAGKSFPDADQQKLVESMLGRVQGHTQQEWLVKQLTALGGWRNAIVRAEQVVAKRREKIETLLDRARKRLEDMRHQISRMTKVNDRLKKRLKHVDRRLQNAKDHPGRNKDLIRQLQDRKGGLHAQLVHNTRTLRQTGRLKDALKEKVIPALTGQRGRLKDTAGTLADDLVTVQGLGGPHTIIKSLPVVGTLGGSILDAQLELRDLTRNPPRVTAEDTGDSTDARDSQRADALAELLQQANQRNAVLAAQFDVFKNTPPFAGSFGTGGVIDGRKGQARTAIVHGGEGVFTPDQMQAMGGGGDVRVIIHGDIISDRRDPVEVLLGDRRFDAAVERANRRTARNASRGLAGRGGGTLR